MPFRQTPVSHTPYVIVAFDKNGLERKDDPDGIGGVISARILSELQQAPPTDLFVFSHGWQGDLGAAVLHYDRWIDALTNQTADAAKMGPAFRAARIGLHWPSKPWGDEKLLSAGSGTSFDLAATPADSNTLELFLDRLDLHDSLRGRELLGQIFRENRTNAGASRLPASISEAYRELAHLIGYESEGAGANPAADNAPFDPQAAFDAMNSTGASFGVGGLLSGILGPLGQLSFWTMKKRGRAVGESGMFQFIAQVQQIAPGCRIHLIGHSFGCIVVSSICAGPNGKVLPRAIDTLTLLQGAVSLWCYADAIPSTGGKGFYNPLVHRRAVRGPILTTRSSKDIAVNVWYPAAVSLAMQSPDFGINPARITWGAIGAFGIQGLPGVLDMPMLPDTSDYHFEPGKIYNLEASKFIAKMEGASGAHSDVYEPEVMHAIWQSVFAASAIGTVTAAAEKPVETAFQPAPQKELMAAVPAPAEPAAHQDTTIPRPAAAVIVKQMPLTDRDSPLPFGVSALNGHLLPPVDASALDRIPRDSLSVALHSSPSLGVAAGVNPDDLSESGWGMIFASQMDQAVKGKIQEALQPLLNLRKRAAGDLFKIFDGATGYHDGDNAEGWVVSRGGGMFSVVPGKGVPYYLLLIGGPDQIPFDFQYNLSMFYASGRLCFRTPEEYATYASNIVKFETGETLQKRVFAMFNTRNEGDRATALLHDQVAIPLLNGADGLKPLGQSIRFSTVSRLADNADKANLLKLLRGETDSGAPALLYTGSHGVDFSGVNSQIDNQGALLTQDWAGGNVTPDTYFTGEDVPADAKTLGMIHYMFACYGAGCPEFDTYSGTGAQGKKISDITFVSRLPQKLLLSGVQAVIGHIDRAFATSFQNSLGQQMFQGFRDPMVRILQGKRVGDAMDETNRRWMALSTNLLQMQINRDALAGSVSDAKLANCWTARDDARNYVILGDPAVRLRPAPAQDSITPAPMGAGGAVSFGVRAAPASQTEAVDFEIARGSHIDSRPKLTFRDFTGAIPMKAAVSPDCSFQLVSEAFTKAHRNSTVDVYIYSISAPYLMKLLKDAHDVGATVRVMYDPNQMAAADANTLRGFGLDVRIAPSHDPRRVFAVCHQKFVVIDRTTLVLESANWAQTSIPERQAGGPRVKGNREWLIRADHQELAGWYADLFQADWDIPEQPSFGVSAAAAVAPLSFRAPRQQPPHDFAVADFAGQTMTVRPLTSPDNYLDSVFPLIQGARKKIWLQQQYIEGQGGTSVPRLVEAIAKRRAAGVEVKIIVSSRFPSGWTSTKDTLQNAGLLDALRGINLDLFTHCHNKGVIVDDSVVVSSTNWSENSITRAREAGLMIHCEAVTDYFAGVFDDDWNTGWSVATADSQGSSFSVSAGGADSVAVDPADRDQ